jgi:hypothetical protein
VKSHAEFVKDYNLAQDEEAGTQVYKPARRNADGTLYRIPYSHKNPTNTLHPAQARVEAGTASVKQFASDLAHQPELLDMVSAALYDDGEQDPESRDAYSLLSEYQLEGPKYPDAPTPSVETEAPALSAKTRSKKRQGAPR